MGPYREEGGRQTFSLLGVGTTATSSTQQQTYFIFQVYYNATKRSHYKAARELSQAALTSCGRPVIRIRPQVPILNAPPPNLIGIHSKAPSRKKDPAGFLQRRLAHNARIGQTDLPSERACSQYIH